MNEYNHRKIARAPVNALNASFKPLHHCVCLYMKHSLRIKFSRWIHRGNLFVRSSTRGSSPPEIDVANFTDWILRKVYSTRADGREGRGRRAGVTRFLVVDHRPRLIWFSIGAYNYTWQAIFMCWAPLARFLSTREPWLKFNHAVSLSTYSAYPLSLSPFERRHPPAHFRRFFAFPATLWNVSSREFAFSACSPAASRPIKSSFFLQRY